ncbi:MAG: M16 family metallopeptidase [Desulfococcaceae bacterium]
MQRQYLRWLTQIIAIIAVIFTFSTFSCTSFTGQEQSGKNLETKQKNHAVSADWPHENSDLPPDPSLIFGKLDNGLRYVLMKNTTPRDRVSMHLQVLAGSLHETEEQRGLAHFLEHMLFNGSEHFKPGELVKYFQSIGMDFGPDANAHTGFRETVYDVLLPKSDAQSIRDGLLVMYDYANSALLLESEVDRERRVILAEMRSRDSADYRTFVKTISFELPDTLIPRRIPIGTKEVVEKSGSEHLKAYYDTWYRPEKMILVMVGDMDTETARSLVSERFSPLRPRTPAKAEPDPGLTDHTGIAAFYHHESENGNTEITIEVLERTEPEPDSFAYQKKYLIRGMADRIVQNRLETLIRKPDSPFTDASVSSDVYAKYFTYGAISAKCSPENWEKTISTLEQTLRTALKYGFTSGELDRVKKELLAQMDKAVKNAGTRESTSLANAIMQNLSTERVFQSPQQEKDLYEPVITALALEDVNQAFRNIWSPDHRLILVTGNADLKSLEMPAEEMILSVYEESTRMPVSAPDPEKNAEFPYLPEPEETGRISFRNNITDQGIIQISFENGFRLNLKQTDFTDNEIIARLTFGSGQSSEPADKPGMGILSHALINESGLGALTSDELERALAGKNTRVRFAASQEYFSFEAKSVSEETRLMFQLLYAFVNDPGFREDAYLLSMERLAQTYQEMSRTVDGAMPLFGNRFLARGDSRFGMPEYEAFKKLKLADVQKWIRSGLEKRPYELSIVGDFDPDTVIALAAKYFGTIPLKSGYSVKERIDQPGFPAGESLEIPVQSNIPKAMVQMTYPTDDMWDIARTRRISILARVYSDRLRELIREKLGAAYSPHAYNEPSRAYPGYGVFHAVITVNPDEVQKVLSGLKNIAADMAEKGITADELHRAVEPSLTGIKDMLRENTYWLNTVLTDCSRHPEQIEWSRTIAEDYASISVEDIAEMARKYLDNKKAAVIVAKPADAVSDKTSAEKRK